MHDGRVTDNARLRATGRNRIEASVGLALLMGLAVCASAKAQTVRAWPTAVVVDDEIRIGDLCDVSGFDVGADEQVRDMMVAPAPPTGGSSLILLDDIREALRGHGVNLAKVIVKGSSRVEVTRPGVPQVSEKAGRVTAGDSAAPPDEPAVSPDETPRTLRAAVIEHFQREVDRVGGTARVQFGRTGQSVLELAEPEFAFHVRRRSGRVLGMVSIEVTVRREGRIVQTVPMAVNVSFVKPVLVAQRAINAKAPIRPDDVQIVDMTFTQFTQVGLADPARAIGQRAKRYIAAGETIHARQLEPVPLVRRGQVVDVYTTSGGVTVVTAAKAMENGAYGQPVTLRAEGGRRRTFTGVVSGPRRVDVKSTEESEMGDANMLAGADQ